ncbi:MAG TPA: GNAT family N-acetyltransferase [Rhizomicrobium sp.]|nr:GNAT family N-acetyltransferase [Rhizomicrobium sp.]
MSFDTEKLRRDHDIVVFDCGNPALNQFLVRYALQNQQSDASQTYVLTEKFRVIGYYTLVVGHVSFDDAPERLKRGLARHPIPLMTLARLAINVDRQGQGLGSALLKDAMARTLQAADIAGIRAFDVQAKDNVARDFYLHFNFDPSPADPLHLFLLTKEIKALFR